MWKENDKNVSLEETTRRKKITKRTEEERRIGRIARP